MHIACVKEKKFHDTCKVSKTLFKRDYGSGVLQKGGGDGAQLLIQQWQVEI